MHFFTAVTFAGLIADSRTLVERAQMEAQNFWFTYNRKIRVEDVTMSVANLALQFGDDDAKVGAFFFIQTLQLGLFPESLWWFSYLLDT